MALNSKILITGAAGFLGSRIVRQLCKKGYTNIRCMVRSRQYMNGLSKIKADFPKVALEFIEGNLISQTDATKAINGVDLIIHCAAGKGGPIASMYLNSVVATRNLMEAAKNSKTLRRIVHISSFSVYGTAKLDRNVIIDEKTPLEQNLKKRNDGYAYVKIKQEEIVKQYEKDYNISVVILRPGVIYGPGGDEISRRVGVRLFGIFWNIGRENLLPLSYVDNCADAIIQAGIVSGIEGEIINIHDNDLRTCSEFLGRFKKDVKNIKSIKVPYGIFWIFSWLIETYAKVSKGQIPPVFSPYKTASIYKKRYFNNHKSVALLKWTPCITTEEGLTEHFSHLHQIYSGSN